MKALRPGIEVRIPCRIVETTDRRGQRWTDVVFPGDQEFRSGETMRLETKEVNGVPVEAWLVVTPGKVEP
jgi:ribosomal protein L19